MQPDEFWAAVGEQVGWTRNGQDLGGDLLFKLIILILSARAFHTDEVSFLIDNGDITEDEGVEMMGDSDLIRAINGFKGGMSEAHGRLSPIKNLYIPTFIYDSDNEGTAEATQERFQQRIWEGQGNQAAPPAEADQAILAAQVPPHDDATMEDAEMKDIATRVDAVVLVPAAVWYRGEHGGR
jgi:hypothetical protein